MSSCLKNFDTYKTVEVKHEPIGSENVINIKCEQLDVKNMSLFTTDGNHNELHVLNQLIMTTSDEAIVKQYRYKRIDILMNMKLWEAMLKDIEYFEEAQLVDDELLNKKCIEQQQVNEFIYEYTRRQY
ncbi:hypothetical protein I4U23_017569 [Adineta vaga]|nr:hypothetical protein I4U23_017569 [Adineta vaga]